MPVAMSGKPALPASCPGRRLISGADSVGVGTPTLSLRADARRPASAGPRAARRRRLADSDDWRILLGASAATAAGTVAGDLPGLGA